MGVCLCIYVGPTLWGVRPCLGCYCVDMCGVRMCFCVWCATSTPTLCVFDSMCYVGCDDTKCVCVLVCETGTVRMSMCVCLCTCTGSISRFAVYNVWYLCEIECIFHLTYLEASSF